MMIRLMIELAEERTSSISAKIRTGIAISDIDDARQHLVEPAAADVAAKTPSVPPITKERSVVSSAMPMVLRAP